MIQNYHALSEAAAAVDELLDDLMPELMGVIPDESLREAAQLHARLKLTLAVVWDRRPEGSAIPDRA